MTNEKTLRILTEARRKLARPSGWTKTSWFARIRKPGGRTRLCYCIDGALQAAALRRSEINPEGNTIPRGLGYMQARNKLDQLARRRGFTSVINLNDDTKTEKKDVLGLLDEAIAYFENKAVSA